MAKPKDPYDVKLSPEKRDEFTRWLCAELSAAKDARPHTDADIEHWHRLYEQGLTRTGKNKPWADAADLSSYIPTEKVDAMSARIMRTIMVDPIWTVEGWGESAEKAPFVEEFHAWKAEEENVQTYLGHAVKLALIEGRGLIEVYEDTTERVTRKTINAALQIDPMLQRPIVNEQGEFELQVGEDGKYVEVDSSQPSSEVVVDTPERIRSGPAYRIIPYRDFIVLPGHAHDRRDIWGYAKRFTRRLAELRLASENGVYDKDAIEKLGTDNEIAEASTLGGTAIPVNTGTQDDATAEKELWEVLILRDFDGKGERWYLATVHIEKHILLRLRHDDLGQRYVPLIPYQRPGRAMEGYSLVGHKLITVTEEHTAWRNMLADRAAMVARAPIKRLEGSLWDPDEQPFGPGQVITVRDMREVEPMTMPDLSAPLIERERETLSASERLAGINDVALGSAPKEQRTLGEVSMVTEQSFVRMEEIVRNIQEGLEDLAQIRHKIWQRTLAEGTGVDIPERVLMGLEARSNPIAQLERGQKFTADMLQGNFKFKPRGSVETADINKQRQDFIQFLQVLPQLLQAWPAMAMGIQGNIRAARAMLAQALRLFRVNDKQAFLGSEAQQAMQQAMMQPPPMAGPASGMPGPGQPPDPSMDPQAGGPIQ